MKLINARIIRPKFNELVLCYCEIYGFFLGSYDQISGTAWGNWRRGDELGILPPTHWMYLPEKPTK
jgi:hypothetical protein